MKSLAPPQAVAPALLKIETVCDITGVCRSKIRAMASSGRFPRPVRIDRSVRWRAVDVSKWVDELQTVK